MKVKIERAGGQEINNLQNQSIAKSEVKKSEKQG